MDKALLTRWPSEWLLVVARCLTQLSERNFQHLSFDIQTLLDYFHCLA